MLPVERHVVQERPGLIRRLIGAWTRINPLEQTREHAGQFEAPCSIAVQAEGDRPPLELLARPPDVTVLDGTVLDREKVVRMLKNAGCTNRDLISFPPSTRSVEVETSNDRRLVISRGVAPCNASVRVIQVRAYRQVRTHWGLALFFFVCCVTGVFLTVLLRVFAPDTIGTSISTVVSSCVDLVFLVGALAFLFITTQEQIEISYSPHILGCLIRETGSLVTWPVAQANVRSRINRTASVKIPDRIDTVLVEGTEAAFRAYLEARNPFTISSSLTSTSSRTLRAEKCTRWGPV